MPNFQSPKAQKLAQEAQELHKQAESAREPEKSKLRARAVEKEKEADAVERGYNG